MDVSERDSGKWMDTRCLFLTFPGLFGWWWLIGMSCHKTTLANGYYGAWPGWAVSISMLPLTLPHSLLSLSVERRKLASEGAAELLTE